MPIVSFWLNAFIPRTVSGYTQVLAAGPHKGKTAIPLPAIARPLNPFKGWDAGYLTDQRGFDPSPTNSVRMQSLARVELAGPAGPTLIAPQIHRTSGTTEVDLASGAQTGFQMANLSRCQFSVLPRRVSGVFTSLDVQLVGKASDPLVNLSADIDYEGTFTISLGSTPGSVSVSFQGKIDDFPAFDCFASFNGTTKELFRADPPRGNTVVSLLGPASRPISGAARFP